MEQKDRGDKMKDLIYALKGRLSVREFAENVKRFQDIGVTVEEFVALVKEARNPSNIGEFLDPKYMSPNPAELRRNSAADIVQSTVNVLKDLGFTDQEVVDSLMGGARVFSSKVRTIKELDDKMREIPTPTREQRDTVLWLLVIQESDPAQRLALKTLYEELKGLRAHVDAQAPPKFASAVEGPDIKIRNVESCPNDPPVITIPVPEGSWVESVKAELDLPSVEDVKIMARKAQEIAHKNLDETEIGRRSQLLHQKHFGSMTDEELKELEQLEMRSDTQLSEEMKPVVDYMKNIVEPELSSGPTKGRLDSESGVESEELPTSDWEPMENLHRWEKLHKGNELRVVPSHLDPPGQRSAPRGYFALVNGSVVPTECRTIDEAKIIATTVAGGMSVDRRKELYIAREREGRMLESEERELEKIEQLERGPKQG